MALEMVEFMIEWFSAEVTYEGEILFSTDSRNDLIDWANAHKEHASATYYAIYQMSDNGKEQEDAGSVAELINWPEPDEQLSEFELDWQNAGQGPE